MVAPTRHHHTFQDYLDVEEASAVRHEYLNGEIFALAGGTPEHAALAAAIVAILGAELRGGPSRPYSSDVRIRIRATGLATYPDAAVICGQPARDPDSATHVTNPTVVIEVLSESTAEYDRGEKREHYQKLASLRDYVLVAQDRREVEVHERGADGSWTSRAYRGGEIVRIASIGVEFHVDTLYADAGVAV